MGGDSIKVIQFVSKLRKQGYSIKAKEIFQYPTVRELATIIKNRNSTMSISQEKATGSFGLIPIQKWFFEQNFKDANYYNQSILITCSKSIEKQHLESSIEQLIQYHDTLRLRFRANDYNEWEQYYCENVFFDGVYEYNIKPMDNPEETLNLLGTQLQCEFDIKEGPLFGVGLVHGFKDGRDRIILAAHHLLIDGISWRILVRDLQDIYEGANVLEKTHTYMDWLKSLEEYEDSISNEEKKYWHDINECIKENSIAKLSDEKRRKHKKIVIDNSIAELLLKFSNAAYNTRIIDLMLSALALSLGDCRNEENIIVNIESHGREDIFENIDITNTVGLLSLIHIY